MIVSKRALSSELNNNWNDTSKGEMKPTLDGTPSPPQATVSARSNPAEHNSKQSNTNIFNFILLTFNKQLFIKKVL